MPDYFDEKKWAEIIKQPDWYLMLVPELNAARKKAEEAGEAEKEKHKEDVYGFFEKHLRAGNVSLGNENGNWDAERMPIDTVIIHHTHHKPGLSLGRLSAIELARLYAPYYAESTEGDLRGGPISSGHIRNGAQVFYPYHFIVRTDGKVERLLANEEVGWHAGSWEINCRSIAIVLDNDYENAVPSTKELEAMAALIKSAYPHISSERVFGHCEVNIKTTCPSIMFLSKDGKRGWKEDLLKLINQV